MSAMEKVNAAQNSLDQDDLGNVINRNAGDTQKNRSSSFTSPTSLLSCHSDMNIFEKVNAANDSDISEHIDKHNFTNTNEAVSLAEHSDSSEKKITSIFTPQASLLLSYRHRNTIQKGNAANDSDISELENLQNVTNMNEAVSVAKHSDYSENKITSICTPKASLLSIHHHTNTNAAVSFAEYSDYFDNNMSLSGTPQASLLSSSRHTNALEKGHFANYSDISDQEDLCNFTNKNAALSVVENSDISKNNKSSRRTPQTNLLSSHRHIPLSEKGNSANDSDTSEHVDTLNVTNTTAAVCFAEYSDSSEQESNQNEDNITSIRNEFMHSLDHALSMFSNWEGTLTMDMFNVASETVDSVNILHSITLHKNLAVQYYFDPKKYSLEGGFSGIGFTSLKNDVIRNALKFGYKLFCNGGIAKKHINKYKDYRQFKCSMNCRKYKDKANKETDNTNRCLLEYCKERRFGDKNKKGRLPDRKGLLLPRRSSTILSLKGDSLCKFSFYISFDDKGFYAMNSRGCNSHCGHPKITNENSIFPPRLVDKAEKEVAKSIAEEGCSSGVIRNVIRYRTGRLLTLQNVRYLGNLT